MIKQTNIETVYLIDEERAHVVECNAGKQHQALMKKHELDNDSCVYAISIETYEYDEYDRRQDVEYTEWNVSTDDEKSWSHAYREYKLADGKREIESMSLTRRVITSDYTGL